MYVLMMSVEARMPYVHSLKEKRSIRQKILDRLKRDFPVSVAEVNQQDTHRQVCIGLTAVSGDAAFLRNLPEKILHSVESNLDGYVQDHIWDVVPWP